jgi:hypothetical protein
LGFGVGLAVGVGVGLAVAVGAAAAVLGDVAGAAVGPATNDRVVVGRGVAVAEVDPVSAGVPD